MSFGGNNTGFGSTNTGFGKQSSGTGFGQATGGFGTQSQQTGFGTQNQQTAIFGQKPSSLGGFGQTSTATGFGSGLTQTSAAPAFGAGSTTGGSFGQATSTSAFGQTGTSSAFAAKPVFGQTSTTGFGQAGAGGFGQTATSSGFGQTGTGGFGQNTGATGLGQIGTGNFGQAATSSAFGQSGTGGFGQAATSSAFGQSGAGGFGQNTGTVGLGQTATSSAFGQPGTGGFGQTATSSAFGAKPTFGQASTTGGFGQTGAGGLGQTAPSSAFGQAGTSSFGQNTGTSLFGQSTGGSLFGQNTGTSTFGQTSTNTFGASIGGNQPGNLSNQQNNFQPRPNSEEFLHGLNPMESIVIRNALGKSGLLAEPGKGNSPADIAISLELGLNPESPYFTLVKYFYDVVKPAEMLGSQNNNDNSDEYRKAMEDNPDPRCMLPVQVTGFEGLEERSKVQLGEAEKHRAVAEKLFERISKLNEVQLNEISSRIQRLQKRQDRINDHVSGLYRRTAKLSTLTIPLNPEEVKLKEKLKEVEKRVLDEKQLNTIRTEVWSRLKKVDEGIENGTFTQQLQQKSTHEDAVALQMMAKRFIESSKRLQGRSDSMVTVAHNLQKEIKKVPNGIMK